MNKDKRVLVVEDNLINQRLFIIILNNHGCIADSAQDGKEAIDKLRKHNYDVVLMDIQLPVMDGLEATWLIRKEFGNAVRIIGVTAAALPEDKDRALAAGMDVFLTKPISNQQLVEEVLKQ